MKPTLFNEYEAYNTLGYEVYNEFDKMVKNFIREKCSIYSSIEVEQILLGLITGCCAEERLYNALQKRKKEREQKS